MIALTRLLPLTAVVACSLVLSACEPSGEEASEANVSDTLPNPAPQAEAAPAPGDSVLASSGATSGGPGAPPLLNCSAGNDNVSNPRLEPSDLPTVVSANGHRVSIPEGALAEAANVHVKDLAGGGRRVELMLTPATVKFQKPVLVTINTANCGNPAKVTVLREGDPNPVGTYAVFNNEVTFPLDSFSTYALAEAR